MKTPASGNSYQILDAIPIGYVVDVLEHLLYDVYSLVHNSCYQVTYQVLSQTWKSWCVQDVCQSPPQLTKDREDIHMCGQEGDRSVGMKRKNNGSYFWMRKNSYRLRFFHFVLWKDSQLCKTSSPTWVSMLSCILSRPLHNFEDQVHTSFWYTVTSPFLVVMSPAYALCILSVHRSPVYTLCILSVHRNKHQ